jgi:predicted RNA-binding Zn-ribbon protein involved in translation (DUF1610 family)
VSWRCTGTGHPAVEHPGSVYPYCPKCGRELAAQGRKASRRYENAWRSVPMHYASPTQKETDDA